MIEPLLDRLICFWSDARTPHEVLPAMTERLAVSTWYIIASRAQRLWRDSKLS